MKLLMCLLFPMMVDAACLENEICVGDRVLSPNGTRSETVKSIKDGVATITGQMGDQTVMLKDLTESVPCYQKTICRNANVLPFDSGSRSERVQSVFADGRVIITGIKGDVVVKAETLGIESKKPFAGTKIGDRISFNNGRTEDVKGIFLFGEKAKAVISGEKGPQVIELPITEKTRSPEAGRH